MRVCAQGYTVGSARLVPSLDIPYLPMQQYWLSPEACTRARSALLMHSSQPYRSLAMENEKFLLTQDKLAWLQVTWIQPADFIPHLLCENDTNSTSQNHLQNARLLFVQQSMEESNGQ